MYQITEGTDVDRAAVSDWLQGLENVSDAQREKIVTAWVSSWRSSAFESISDIPYSPAVPSYGLQRHVNDVTLAGIDLAARAEARWDLRFEPDELLAILVLHDLDKPLIYAGDLREAGYSQLGRQLPHGVVGAMLLRELGFAPNVVSTVATHAADAPFHGHTPEAWVLHYADMFATDRTYVEAGIKPFYQRHPRP